MFLEHLGRMALPTHDLINHPDRLPGTVRPGRVPREPHVRQVGVVLDRAGGLHPVDPAGTIAQRELRSPGRRIQRRGQVDEVRLLLAEVGAVARLQQVAWLQVGLRAVVEGSGIPDLIRFSRHVALPSSKSGTLAHRSASATDRLDRPGRCPDGSGPSTSHGMSRSRTWNATLGARRRPGVTWMRNRDTPVVHALVGVGV